MIPLAQYYIVCLFAYLRICLFAYLRICVFAYLRICVFAYLRYRIQPDRQHEPASPRTCGTTQSDEGALRLPEHGSPAAVQKLM